MADETNIENPTSASADLTSAAPEPKKNRGGRPKKIVAEAARSDAKIEPSAPAAAVAATGKRKGRAAAKASAPEATDVAKKTRGPRVAKPAQAANAVSPAALDDLADLLTLEEENQKLRKQLAEKLRSENADLKKRLGIA
ncbi:hypothetical protein ASE04_18515 [Rhizobium sp. Root708]|uniref:hypothetical protein n=1 Tax=Rhizobium sp. Root708 TaxID=1736592 RepID=UPI0006F77372|nr:hypothetical protein [Rhizobium sp. Root708]KRB49175.1 hypothetical protein ASE04_18515 [Rhizobium sp. Root708]